MVEVIHETKPGILPLRFSHAAEQRKAADQVKRNSPSICTPQAVALWHYCRIRVNGVRLNLSLTVTLDSLRARRAAEVMACCLHSTTLGSEEQKVCHAVSVMRNTPATVAATSSNLFSLTVDLYNALL